MPELDNTIQVDIRPEDIEMQVYRSSGAGGQHINKTSSAVRLIHKPTGVVVSLPDFSAASSRTRDYAMEMLKAKLYQIAKQQHMDKIDDIKGVQNEIAWGHQIRSYVFMPYTMVKDHRTNYETGNVDAVMDGDLDGFIFAYLKAASRGELQDTWISERIKCKGRASFYGGTAFFVFLRQIRQNGIPEIFLLPQGVEAAVQVHFVCRCKDRAAQKQTFHLRHPRQGRGSPWCSRIRMAGSFPSRRRSSRKLPRRNSAPAAF